VGRTTEATATSRINGELLSLVRNSDDEANLEGPRRFAENDGCCGDGEQRPVAALVRQQQVRQWQVDYEQSQRCC